MKKQSSLLAAIMLATAAISSAQDSVSVGTGTNGDAIDPYAVGEQINDYIVDLVPFSTSWGTTWGIAPLVKTSRGDPAFSNNGMSSQYTSTTLKTGVTPPRATYDLWTSAGGGINDSASINSAGVATLAPASSTQFATTFAEFGFGNHVVTAVANFDPLNPSRLFVTRVQSALNGTSDTDINAQIGLGAVDSDGNTYFRADDFGVAGSNQIVGQNIFRVDALARNGGQTNQIGGTGPSDALATDWLINSGGTIVNTPGCIPEQVAGAPLYIGGQFSAQINSEAVGGGLILTSAHLGTSPDQRGNVGYSNAVIFPGSFGTCTLYGKDGAFDTRNLLFFGTKADGNVVGTASLPMPGSAAGTFTDNSTGFTWPEAGDAVGEFIHGSSQVAFRGGNGQVAVGMDQNGMAFAAAVAVADDAAMPVWFTENPINALIVARFDPANIAGTVAWTTVAYTENVGVGTAGKPILDGPGGTPIGQIVWMDTATGGAAVGPSISNPMIDSVGNIWFSAGVELFGSPSDFDTALIRGVYDSSSFSYELELVLELGDTFHGANSDRDWQIQFIGVADTNSIASGATNSNNMTQAAYNNMSTMGMAVTDPQTMGGMVINVGMTYDWDNDGTFDTAGGFDQNYTAMLYLGYTAAACTSMPEFYCTAGTTANACQATLSVMGSASATAASGFTLTASSIEGNKDGLFFYGTNGRQTAPWGNGTSLQCVVPPVKRLGLLPGNGTNGNCDGTKSQDLNALWCPTCPNPAKNPGSGAVVQAQLWFRDPLNTSNQTTSFSNAVEFTVCP